MSIQAGKAQGKLLRKLERLLSHLFLYGGLGPLIGMIGFIITPIIIYDIIKVTPPISYGGFSLKNFFENLSFLLYLSYFAGLPPALATGIIASCLRKGRWLSFFLIILSGWLVTVAYMGLVMYILRGGSIIRHWSEMVVLGLLGALAALVCSLLGLAIWKHERPE